MSLITFLQQLEHLLQHCFCSDLLSFFARTTYCNNNYMKSFTKVTKLSSVRVSNCPKLEDQIRV